MTLIVATLDPPSESNLTVTPLSHPNKNSNPKPQKPQQLNSILEEIPLEKTLIIPNEQIDDTPMNNSTLFKKSALIESSSSVFDSANPNQKKSNNKDQVFGNKSNNSNMQKSLNKSQHSSKQSQKLENSHNSGNNKAYPRSITDKKFMVNNNQSSPYFYNSKNSINSDGPPILSDSSKGY